MSFRSGRREEKIRASIAIHNSSANDERSWLMNEDDATKAPMMREALWILALRIEHFSSPRLEREC